MGEDLNCNQYGFINGKSTLSDILESIDILYEYLLEMANTDIYLDFREAYLIRYLIIVYKWKWKTLEFQIKY